MIPRTILSKAVAVLLFAVMLVLPVTAAADVAVIEPGELATFPLPDGEITDIDPQIGEAKAAVLDGKNVLVFRPPEGIMGARFEIPYKANGVDGSLEVFVSDAAQTFGDPEVYNKVFQALFVLFALAVIVESALQLIFRWRPYVTVVNTSGANGIVAFFVSLFLVVSFDLDITTQIINAYTGPANAFANGHVGTGLTALIIAGGSSGVNRILRRFGFRPIGPPDEVSGPPDDDIAWLSVSVERSEAIKGDLQVLYGPKENEAVIGTIPSGKPKPLGWFWKNFFRDGSRFPPSGGFTVPVVAEKQRVIVKGFDTHGKDVSASWGPERIGPRAIVDISLKPRLPKPDETPEQNQ